MLKDNARPDCPAPHSRRDNDLAFFKAQDLKQYPHFDAPISLREANALVRDPLRVARNAFFPLLMFVDKWQPYRTHPTGRPDKKSRPIRYGARRDAYIFAHYRKILSTEYEKLLAKHGLSGCVIAYRKILKDYGGHGKCNIDFASDAFRFIEDTADCVAITMDISQYFESLDHDKIKSKWQSILGVDRLPSDHFAVYKNITKYRFVNILDVYQRLGYFGDKLNGSRHVKGFLQPYRDIPKQLCSPQVFREKICGESPLFSSIIQKNDSGRGVPQGAPISDLLANLYLFDFDRVMQEYVMQRGGKYMRYSDDILIIIPSQRDAIEDITRHVTSAISNVDERLIIKQEKTSVVEFFKRDGLLHFRHILGKQGVNGLEYLGFRFTGKNVYIRDSTISRLYRKVSAAAKREAYFLREKYPNLSNAEIMVKFNFSLFSQRFLRVRDYEENLSYHGWTFFTYIKRSASIFGEKGQVMFSQLDRFEEIVRTRVENALSS